MNKRSRQLKILITAGPTRERIDPVRFISNYSTGRMGYEVASMAAARSHSVVLVSGPGCLEKPRGIKTISVESALDMRAAVLREFRSCDALVMTAAVCDFRPKVEAKKKIKKFPSAKIIKLVENPDILLEAGRRKGKRIAAGFALETESLEENARKKLKEKGLDFIVANRISKGARIFGDTRADYLIIDKFGRIENFRRYSKKGLAGAIIDKVEGLCYS